MLGGCGRFRQLGAAELPAGICVCPSQLLPASSKTDGSNPPCPKTPARQRTLQHLSSDKFNEEWQPWGEETREEKCKETWTKPEEMWREMCLCKEALHAQGWSPGGTMAMVDDLCQGRTPLRDSGHGQSLLVGHTGKHRGAEKSQHGGVKTTSYTPDPDLLYHPSPHWMNAEKLRMNCSEGEVRLGIVEDGCLDEI